MRQLYRLTCRETDILRRTLDGLKNIEIAEDLEISEQTGRKPSKQHIYEDGY